MRCFSLWLLLLLVAGLNCWGQGAHRVYRFRRYPLDSLKLLSKQADVPDTMRVFFLNRLAVSTSSTDLAGAVEYINQAAALAHKIGYVRGELNCLKTKGNFYQESGDYVNAQLAYQQGVELASRHFQLEQLAHMHLSMGAMASNTGDGERALRYLLLSLDQFRHVRHGQVVMDDTALVYSNLSNTCFQLHQVKRARKYARVALFLYNQLPESTGAIQANTILGRSFWEQRPITKSTLDSASRYMLRAADIQRQTAEPKEEAGTLLDLATIYGQRGLFPAMRQAAERSMTLAKQVGSLPYQVEATELLAKSEAGLGNYRNAYIHLQQASDLRQILSTTEKTKALAQLQVKYDVREREQRIKVLQREAQAAAAVVRAQQQRQKWLLGVALLLAVMLLGGAVFYVKLRRRRLLLAQANLEIQRANREIQEAMVEKEVLVQEIHHRVKNNLQLISSLLAWQTSTIPDPTLAAVLGSSQARIQSMALVHEFLYQADNLAQVRLDTYLPELLNSLHQSLSSPRQTITLTMDIDPLIMEAKDASAFGLLVSELVTNAFKHAFKGREVGTLHVRLAKSDTHFMLQVVDDGLGLPAIVPLGKPKSLGMQIVSQLAKQLKAKFTISAHSPSGTCAEVIRVYSTAVTT
jgi:two-component sensor histidine kinase